LKVWDLDTGGVRTLDSRSNCVFGLALTADGKRAISASVKLKVWDLAAGKVLFNLEGHHAMVNAVVVTPDGNRAVSASDDRTLKIWDLGTGLALRTLEGHTGRVQDVAVTADGRRLVSTSYDGTLRVWDLDSGLLTATFRCDGQAVCCACVDEQRIVAGDMIGHVYFLALEE
jgi:WD40 repeat protein